MFDEGTGGLSGPWDHCAANDDEDIAGQITSTELHHNTNPVHSFNSRFVRCAVMMTEPTQVTTQGERSLATPTGAPPSLSDIWGTV